MQGLPALRLWLTLILNAAAPGVAAQQIAITIDDLPYVMPSQTTPDQGLAQVQQINSALARHGITAVGFAVGQQINRRSRPALQEFARAGHTIGNHSWSHPDYNTLTAQEFRTETKSTDRAMRRWLDEQKYYRFPFLREGQTEAAHAAGQSILAELGYQNVPVTIDNNDWQYNADYLAALTAGDTAAAQQVADAYVSHMQERSMHFQTMAQNTLGRDVRHILLLHMNQINADHLVDLLDWYASEGWSFVTVQYALQDPIYQMPNLYTGQRGISHIERITGTIDQ